MLYSRLKPGMCFVNKKDPKVARRIAYLLRKTKNEALFFITGNREPFSFASVKKTPRQLWSGTWMHNYEPTIPPDYRLLIKRVWVIYGD
jgi:hypothetical protein